MARKGKDMKLVIVKKGGSGSGFFGHAGRPGEVGGSSGLSGGALDESVAHLGFSSKTKSLAAYAKNGLDDKNIKAASDATIKAKIPLKDRLGFAAYVANAKMNGAGFTFLTKTGGVLDNRTGDVPNLWDAIYRNHKNSLNIVYAHTKRSTLDKWNEAITKIDEAFQGHD
jgi:RNAse (barnase) inhibitor barstar